MSTLGRLIDYIRYGTRDIFTVRPAGDVLPPLRMQHDGPRGYETFQRNGVEVRTFYTSVLGMLPSARVLDVGSGIGRKSIPLMQFFDSSGLYVGLEPCLADVKWCSAEITTRAPRLTFVWVDVRHQLYNIKGKLRADQLTLPWPDESFDYVTIWSVFTHLYAREVGHYLNEVSRVLKPGGVVASSYFLINARAREAVRTGSTAARVLCRIQGDACWTCFPRSPLAWIGLDEEWIRSVHESAGLHVEDPLRYGSWSNNSVPEEYASLNFQDIVVARRQFNQGK
jgi:SAM-dependent methyltransferase